jgi:3-deoxy-manno-octulosonate cytidylyltransferase (CMP-KDO synthetase)
MSAILGIIPARFASTRFPGKPLADIAGKSMIQRVVEQAKKASSLQKVVVATDDQRIFEHVQALGHEAVMTSPTHPTGTDRCKEVVEKVNGNFDYAINIQGDEPFIQPQQIDLLAECLDGKTELATLVKKIEDYETLVNPNAVRVIINAMNEAIYFTRETLPHVRGKEKSTWLEHFTYYKHIGIYAYRTDILQKITELPQGKLELAESLEQLRWIENGLKIKVNYTEFETQGIDTPEDLERAVRLLNL